MRRKPVVLVASPSLDAISGVTTHALSLLNSSLPAQFEMRHFQVGSEGRAAESAAQRWGRFLLSPLALAWEVLRGADVVHLNTSLNAKAFWRDAAYLAVAKLLGARVVLQKHGGTLAEFMARNPAPLVRAVLRLADAVAVLSRAELAEYTALLKGRPVVLLPNGVDMTYFRKRIASEKRDPVLQLVYVGRLAPRKGLEEILDAVALAKGRGVKLRVAIAGGGPSEAALRSRIDELGLGDTVELVGPAFGEGKIRLLYRADALLLPSHSEGLPYAVLEGMAAGTVPIVTPVGAIPDVVEDGIHGLHVPVGDAAAIADAIGTLAADRGRLERMSGASRRRIASGYSIDRLVAEVAGVYATLAPARAPRTVL